MIWKRLIVILFNKFLSEKVANIKIRHYKDLHLGNGGFVKKRPAHLHNTCCIRQCESAFSIALICKLIWASLRGLASSSGAKIQYKSYLSLIPQHFFLWENFIYWSDIFGIYLLVWGFFGVLGSCIIMKSPTQINGEVWKTTKNTSITEYFAATSTFAQYRFGKFFQSPTLRKRS